MSATLFCSFCQIMASKSIFFCTFCHILHLQVETDDYDGGKNGASDTSDCSCGVNSGTPSVRQVSNFMSDNFVTCDIRRYF